ncbi:MAG TPA: RHS repeat-associated core domain-containing protein [Longimicrobium sp.]|nr:RHS repeat-associated core domain-containing protein [Longimicrobium sp.]
MVAAMLGMSAALAAPATARAQDCLPPGSEQYQTMPVCPVAPRVTLSPGSLDVGQPAVQVTVTAEDELIDGNHGSFSILVDGVNVTQSWGYTSQDFGWGTGRARRYTSRGTVALSQTTPVHSVQVQMCDATECSNHSATYRLALPGVAVTPDGPHYVGAASAIRMAWFTVTNQGTVPATYTLTPECRFAFSGAPSGTCSVSAASVTLAPEAWELVMVTFAATAADSVVSVRLTARQTNQAGVQDAGWIDVTVLGGGGSQQAPAVRIAELASDTTGLVDRGECVTVAAGAGAAYECGDLRLVHALPTTATRGRTRTPVLLYNSQHAHPRPTVYADVTMPATASPPGSIEATVTLAGGASHTRTFSGADFHPGTTRRIAVQWDGTTMGFTSLYDYTLQVTAIYSGAQYQATPVTGSIAVVNRSNSSFGAGWWLSGLEQLKCINCLNGGRLLLVLDDGSTRVYRTTVVGSVWTALQPDGPADTITLSYPGGVATYTRPLRGGGRKLYNGSGQHYATINRLNHWSSFGYDAQGRVYAAWAPAPTGYDVSWWFYLNADGKLDYVCAYVTNHGCRITDAGTFSDGRISYFDDPDGRRVSFGYGSSEWLRRVSTRTDRRGTVVSYAYDAGGKLASVKLPLAPGDTITSTFRSAEGLGVGTSIALGAVYTRLDGPRTEVSDNTWLWLTRWGAPMLIRDALGNETRIRRGEGTFRALATTVIAPNGLTTTATYDSRGRVATSTVVNPLGTGQNAVTTYTYDNRCDAPTSITAPLVAAVTMAYDQGNCNLLWQQQGDAGRRVNYRYYTSGPAVGQLRAVQAPADARGQVAVDSLGYDALGNLSFIRTPLGFLTHHYRDALGRDTLVITPTRADSATWEAGLRATGVRQRITWDVMSRVTRTATVGPAMLHVSTGGIIPLQTGIDTLVVTTTYNEEGQPGEVLRWASPDTARVHILSTTYEYDLAGRRTGEHDGFVWQRYAYDRAGNMTTWTTPRGHQVRTEYDALGRVTRRIVPGVAYAAACPSGTSPCANPYPHHPNGSGGSLVIAEEWTHYRYDAAGNQVFAENADAVVQRSYYRNGLLETDTLRIRGLADGSFTGHVYGLAYGYDLAGRAVWMRHPQNLAGGQNLDQWGYDPVTGALNAAQDRLGNSFSWSRDNTGQVTGTTAPGGVSETLRYDREGRLVRRIELGAYAGTLHDDSLFYDARGKLMQVNVGPTSGRGASTYRQWYSGSGMLIGTDWQNEADAGRVQEAFGMDAMGNTAWRRSGDGGYTPEDIVFRNTHDPGRGRLARIQSLNLGVPSATFQPEETTRTYDFSGNADWGVNVRNGHAADGMTWTTVRDQRSRSYYAADERLRYFQERDLVLEGTSTTLQGVWEEYRYDPLGRRVLVNTRRKDLCTDNNAFLCAAAVTRMVWAGDQLLWEIRGTSEHSGERIGPAAAYGTVGYSHAGGIDRPLVITKDGVSIIPHQNWRGQFSRGTYANGTPSDCPPGVTTGCTPIPWPGYRTTAWHVGRKELDIRNWYGGLVDGMRDASGQMYMRNRYYDPATGQFTQTDPIRLAGGLNAYGFAAGDPVSYSDPFGSCPEPKNGWCPGGLSVDQYNQIRTGVEHFATGRARIRLLNLLKTGGIRLVADTHNGNPAGADVWSESAGIVITEAFFGTSDIGYDTVEERIWVLAHEDGHLLQDERRRLLYFQTEAEINSYFKAREGRLHWIHQRDADAYACRHTTEQGDWEIYCSKAKN